FLAERPRAVGEMEPGSGRRGVARQAITVDRSDAAGSALQKRRVRPPRCAPLALAIQAILDTDRDVAAHTGARAGVLPCQEVLSGFMKYARRQVRAVAGASIDVLSPSAIATLEEDLLTHLCFVASLTLGREFYEFRFHHAPLSAFEFPWSRQKPSTKI